MQKIKLLTDLKPRNKIKVANFLYKNAHHAFIREF